MAIKVPPGQHPPFEVIDDQHHAGIIIITTAICLVIALVCLLIRVYVRFLLSSSFGIDDLVLLAATTFAIVQSVVVFYASSIGFGTAITLLDSHTIRSIQKSILASDVLYLITLYLSKCCIVAIYQRLTPLELHKFGLWATLALATAGVITSVLIITIDCSLNTSWVTPAQSCTNLMARWGYITAIDIITEIILFTFSIALVHKLQMAWRHKFVIILSFACRLPLIAFESLRLSRFHTFVQSENPTFTAIDHFVWTQVELYYSLIACTVFCLRPFMDAITTHYGTAGDYSLGSSSRTQQQSASSRSQESYALQSVAREHIGRKAEYIFPTGAGTGTVEANTLAPRGNSRGGAGNSDHEEDNSVWSVESSRMLIRKDVEYSVSHAPRDDDD